MVSDPQETWLSFSLTPVQGFIEAARTVRDLATGSRILSGMVHAAIVAGQKQGTLLFPDASDNPASLPNRFVMSFANLALAEVASIAMTVAAKKVWTDLASDTKKFLDNRQWETGWDADWTNQIDHYWEIQVRILTRSDANEDIFKRLFGRDETEIKRHWILLSATADTAKQIRNYPGDHGIGRQKCSLLGELEQMGPVASSTWWEKRVGTRKGATRIGERDKLCAVSLVKRFAPVAPSARNEISAWATSVSDTATVATARWCAIVETRCPDEWKQFKVACQKLNQTLDTDGPGEGIPRLLLEATLTKTRLEKEYGDLSDEVNDVLNDVRNRRATLIKVAKEVQVPISAFIWGQSEQSSDVNLTNLEQQVSLGPPSRYLAAIALDGDKMGSRLARLGEKEEFRQISRQLRAYAIKSEEVVKQYDGQHMYAGGDDCLALNHAAGCLPCAGELQAAFPNNLPGGENNQDISTVSMGVVFFHYKHDLRDALRQAREAEQQAKADGRNRLAIRVLKRSGGDIHVTALYDDLQRIQHLAHLFRAGSGFGWLSSLHSVSIALQEANRPQVRAQIRAFLGHAEGLTSDAYEVIDSLLASCEKTGGNAYGVSGKVPFVRFLKFMEVATFLARGRE